MIFAGPVGLILLKLLCKRQQESAAFTSIVFPQKEQ